jgi:uncharacterized protein (TIGR03437 family)
MGSASMQLPVAPSAPGIFAAVASAPGVVTLYATGGGALAQGSPAPLALLSTVTVNGEPATVLYAGIAPGLPQGANQINVQLPADARTGTITIVWTAGSASSKPFAFAQ